MLEKIKQNTVAWLIIKAFSLYIIWFLLYDLWLHPAEKLDRLVINNIVHSSSFVLKSVGYRLIPEPPPEETIRTIGIDGTHGLWIGDPCNGLSVMAVFAGFILIQNGKWKNKLRFVTLGIISIHIINILRVCGLCMILYYTPTALEFNHTYSFTLIIYSYVFILWMIWVNKLGKTNTNLR